MADPKLGETFYPKYNPLPPRRDHELDAADEERKKKYYNNTKTKFGYDAIDRTEKQRQKLKELQAEIDKKEGFEVTQEELDNVEKDVAEIIRKYEEKEGLKDEM